MILDIKYDGFTESAKQNLKSLQKAFVDIICEKSLENIRVVELCEKSGLPKSSFYSYFHDKYEYVEFWLNSLCVTIEKQVDTGADNLALEGFSVFYDVANRYKDIIRLIFQSNPIRGDFSHCCFNVLESYFVDKMTLSGRFADDDNTRSLVAKNDAYVTLTVLEWIFVFDHKMTKEQAIKSICNVSGETSNFFFYCNN